MIAHFPAERQHRMSRDLQLALAFDGEPDRPTQHDRACPVALLGSALQAAPPAVLAHASPCRVTPLSVHHEFAGGNYGSDRVLLLVVELRRRLKKINGTDRGNSGSSRSR